VEKSTVLEILPLGLNLNSCSLMSFRRHKKFILKMKMFYISEDSLKFQLTPFTPFPNSVLSRNIRVLRYQRHVKEEI